MGADLTDIEYEIEDLQKQLREVESENLNLYNQCKSTIGFPVCGERPPTPSDLTDEELLQDAKVMLEKWLVFARQLNALYKAAHTSVMKKFKKYKGEKDVPVSEVTTGKSVEEALESGRFLDL